MPETFPNRSVSDIQRDVDTKVDELRSKIEELEHAILVEEQRVRDAIDAPPASPAPQPASESAPVPIEASTEPEPSAPALPPALPVDPTVETHIEAPAEPPVSEVSPVA